MLWNFYRKLVFLKLLDSGLVGGIRAAWLMAETSLVHLEEQAVHAVVTVIS